MSDEKHAEVHQGTVEPTRPAWRPQDADREVYRYETKKRIQHYTVPPQTIFRPAKPTPTIRDESFKRVAVYARVSTKSKEQVSSIENQTKYYTEKIARTPNWELTEVYSDEGNLAHPRSGALNSSECWQMPPTKVWILLSVPASLVLPETFPR